MPASIDAPWPQLSIAFRELDLSSLAIATSPSWAPVLELARGLVSGSHARLAVGPPGSDRGAAGQALRVLRRLADVLARRAPDPSLGAPVPLLGALDAFASALHDATSAPDETLVETSRAHRDGDALVIATAARALRLAARGDTDAGIQTARRTFRMARAEGGAVGFFCAALALARLRRLEGAPIVAAQMLRTTQRFLPPAWRPLFEWELHLSTGGRLGDAHELAVLDAPLGRLPGQLVSDALRLRVALGHDALDVAGEDPLLRAWCGGLRHAPPHGLVAFGGGDNRAVALAVYDPTRPPRRVLASPSLPPALRDLPSLPETDRRNARLDRGIAVLTLAGASPIDEDAFFRETFGTAFTPDLHRGVLNVLLQRMRGALEGIGVALSRDRGALRLESARAFAVRDPRCEPRFDARTLQVLCERGALDANEAAAALGMTRRAASTILRQLHEAGVVIEQREGPRHVYVVEDTTFTSPTHTEELPRWLRET